MLNLGPVGQKEFLVVDIEEKIASNGNKYLSVKLVNKDEEVRGKVWEEDRTNCQLAADRVSAVDGLVSAFMGQPSLTIKSARFVDRQIEGFLPKIPTIVFDIETVGKKFKDLTEKEQDYLLNNLEKEEKDKDLAKEKTGLYAIFGSVCAIGMYNPDTERGLVLVVSDKEDLKPENDSFGYKSFPDEKSLLMEFWQISRKYQKFVSYNGRGFDVPYLVIRSAINRVKINTGLRIGGDSFIDLQEKFKQSRPFKLEFLCQAFGVENPKEKGVSGLEINKLFYKKKYQTIADYVARDAYSTAKLYGMWKEYIGL